jgi:hypothetical protein
VAGALALLLGAALLVAGCSRDAGDEVLETTPVMEAAEADAPVPDPFQVPPGESRVRITDGGVTVVANRAARVPILRRLGELFGFELTFAAEARAEGEVTLRAVDEPLAVALALLLEGIPHAIEYDASRLTRVMLGRSQQTLASARPGGDPGATPADSWTELEPRAESDPAAQEERRREREVKYQEDQAAYLAQISDPDPAVRAEAAEFIDPDTEAIVTLRDLIVNDPDPSVRKAAAENLGGAITEPTAVNALLQALSDPEPEVVIGALDAIEFVGDHTVIPDITFLLSHEEPAVRERTVEAIEWLEE